MISSKILSKSQLGILFDFWTDGLKNNITLFVCLLLPQTTLFLVFEINWYIWTPYLNLLNIYTKQHSDTKRANTKKMPKYYISKSKRNKVCKITCTPISMGIVVDKVALGQIFHCHYHSINDAYSFIHLLPALYNLNNWQGH